MDAPAPGLGERPEDPFALHNSASAVLDDQGRIVGWSERAQEHLGYLPDEVLGRMAVEFLCDSRDREAVLDAAAACQRDRGWSGVLPVLHRSGRRVELGFRARAVIRAGSAREWFLVVAPAEEVLQWETDRSVLDGMFRRSPIGLSVHAPDLSILRINRALARFTQLSAAEIRGRRAGDFLIGPDLEVFESRLRRVLETGEPLIFTEQPCRLRSDPGHERVVSVSAFRMQDPAGGILGVTQLVEDVTDRYRARRRLALLNRASARIGTTLDLGQTTWELADVAVPVLADAVSVDLLEPVARGEETDVEASGLVRRMAVQSVMAEALQVMYPAGEVFRFDSRTSQARCLAERQPILEPVLQSSPGWYFQDSERTQRAFGLGAHSLIVVPLTARGLLLGLLSLWRARRPEPFEEDDLTLAEEFAARAALCIDNARRYTQQHLAALTLQRSLLPRELPEHSAVEVAHRYLPADAATGVGGDWFDVIPLSGARVALVVGDVVGHGLHAAATMGRLRTAVHTLASLDYAPDEVLSHLDDLVNRLAAEQEPADGRSQGQQIVGATCLYAVYDPISQRCTLARAGHLPPAVVASDGTVSLPDLPEGPPLGLGGLPFEAAELELAEGSLLALYTDGLVEGRGHDLDEGLKRLREALSLPGRSLEETCTAVQDALLPEHPQDDVALLVARTRVLAPEQVASWELPAEPTAAARARELTEATLTRWGLEEVAFTAELVVSELVTNAYRYGGGTPLTLRLIRDRSLICEVSDSSSTAPHLRRARTTDEGGRGLLLVAQLTERWGTRYTRDGKTVWTELPLATASEGHFANAAMPAIDW
ncbi:SpoIIE family protein phosphatase [Streptomyces sp. NBC_00190]|uniref:SpoIIE family protein phosphatase n=1 Tax=unclassified Streptomyces TaxID=2593676 RepID=UPI002E2BC874|nr:SpoIIE family protein phosphatase [Streptomyces sp. NBC_00190]WSZ38380.1 SpoIIE family protein phosphatase [Streptomyces sp. NBC_00868]